MERFGTAIIFSLALALLACGGASTKDVLTGNWRAGLLNSDGTVAFGFTATLIQNGQTVSVTKFSLISPSSCFALGTTATGLLTMTDTTHGVTSGTFQMTIQSGSSNLNGMNFLTLQGTFVRNAISGSWMLAGTGMQCTESGATSGDFSMIQMEGTP